MIGERAARVKWAAQAGVIEGRSADDGFGWIKNLGVRPKHRGRGIATALLNQSFAEFQKRGYERVGLGVDSDNQSGATGVYERVGMRRDRHHDFYRKELTQSQSPH